jgi:hypothetical protein
MNRMNNLLPILLPKVRVSRICAQFEDGITESEWRAAWPVLCVIDGAVKFWIGDWLVYGLNMFTKRLPSHTQDDYEACQKVSRQRYALALQWTEWERQALHDASWLCRSVPPSVRNEKLSWTHHWCVAPLTHAEQLKFLALAEANHWTASQLRMEIRKDHAEEKPSTQALEFIPRVWVSEFSRWAKHENVKAWPQSDRAALRIQLQPIIDLYSTL